MQYILKFGVSKKLMYCIIYYIILRCIVIYIKIENFNISQYKKKKKKKKRLMSIKTFKNKLTNPQILISSDWLQKDNSFSNLIRHLLQIL